MMKIIFSGGGTGGHIYPAIAVAEEIQKQLGNYNVEILFVGAEGKMEMTKVADFGYKIVGLPVSGLKRKISIENIKIAWNSIKSLYLAKKIIHDFKPDIVIGFGGYASFPIVGAAQILNIPTLLWEGNSFAGIANRILSKKATNIIVSFKGMERFFKSEKIKLLGNPVRGCFNNIVPKSDESKKYFGFDADRPTILVTGGSLGARTLNNSIIAHIDDIIKNKEVNLIWQCGSYYHTEMMNHLAGKLDSGNLWIGAFIENMQYAYELADIAVARSGASSVTELSLSNVATVFVPSPNVTDDHQSKNAQSLVDSGAALMMKDNAELKTNLIPFVINIVKDSERIEILKHKIKNFANPSSAKLIVNLILEITKYERV